MQGSAYAGTYVEFWDVVELCQRYGLTELEKGLLTWTQQAPLKEPELSEFIEITDFASTVMVRRPDFRINANNIFKLAGHSREKGMGLRKRIESQAYDILLGARGKCQGTYVNFNIGIELCREYGLHQLEQRLCSLKRTSEGPVEAAEPNYVGSWSQIFRQLPESIGSERASALNETTQSREVWIRDQSLALSGGLIINRPMETGDAHEMDSGSDVTDSGNGVTSCELSWTQRESQSVPSIRCANGAASPRQSLLESANVVSHSAKSAQYEVWDSQPQLSELEAVEPDLRPSSWRTASHYGSLDDLFALI